MSAKRRKRAKKPTESTSRPSSKTLKTTRSPSLSQSTFPAPPSKSPSFAATASFECSDSFDFNAPASSESAIDSKISAKSIDSVKANAPTTPAKALDSTIFNDSATSANAPNSTLTAKNGGSRSTRGAISPLKLDRAAAIRKADVRQARFVAAVATLVFAVVAFSVLFGEPKRRFDSPLAAVSPSTPVAESVSSTRRLADAVAAEVEKATLAAKRRRAIVETSVKTADPPDFNADRLADANDKTGVGAVERPAAQTLAFVVELNSASKAELTNLPRVGDTLAERIIERREELGGFRTVDDLLGVKGIGEKTLDKMRPFCVVAPLDDAD
ncbi:MAG: helix-hairpin-helix domain-containing protein [Thermoguttaceae bacterium]|nr:helix-hairpin-helix domain-containing protein [Thermoguttaceae bacterium]